jgi:5-methyltetrahydrofolate--homocysteine methyltransferase
MSNRLSELLAARPWILADGATGTNFFARGLEHGDAPELWNLKHPEKVIEQYRSFIDAGSDLILTNSFGGTRNRLKLHNVDDQCREINRAAAALARQAAEESGRGEIIVGGSMGPTGDLFEPLGPLTLEAGSEAFAEQARGLADGGADVLWIETISAVDEIKAAVAGAAVTGLPVVVTLSFDTNGRTMMGLTPGDFARLAGELDPRPLGYGANCGVGASELIATILSMAEAAGPDDILVAKGNCGIPQFVDGEIAYSGTPSLMADYARLALDSGARIIGGCCGTTPDHIRAMRAALESHEKGDKPDLETIVARLGALSKGAAELQGQGPLGDRPAASNERRRRGRRRGQGDKTPGF